MRLSTYFVFRLCKGLSDFTRVALAITLVSQAFAHLLYQFRLAFSGWRHAQVVQGGESYDALSEGLQAALRRLGGCPREHRTDSLSAAFDNPTGKRQIGFKKISGRLWQGRMDTG